MEEYSIARNHQTLLRVFEESRSVHRMSDDPA
jgi:hypothetical protein